MRPREGIRAGAWPEIFVENLVNGNDREENVDGGFNVFHERDGTKHSKILFLPLKELL